MAREAPEIDIKSARLARGLTQEALARAVPCSTATIVKCEASRRLPRIESLRRGLLAALGLPEAAA